MYFDYFTVLVFASVGLAFVFANLLIASVLRPQRTQDEGLETYECGEVTIGEAWIQFDIRYYTVALVYVVFAVEIAFLFPWAIVLKEAYAGTGAGAGAGIGIFALIEGVIFLAVLALGLAYVWAKGDLDWVLTYSAQPYQPAGRESSNLPLVQELEKEQERLAEERPKAAAAAASSEAAA